MYFEKFQKIVGFGTESSFGVVSTIKEWCNATEAKFGLDIPHEPRKEMYGNREAHKSSQKARVSDSSCGFELEPNNSLGVHFRSHFGTVNSTQVGTFLAYLHEFTNDQNPEITSLFARVNQMGTILKNYIGLFPDKIDITYPKDESVKVAVSFLGQNEQAGTFVGGTFGTWEAYTSSGNLQIWIDGTVNSDITDVKVSLNAKGKKILTVGTANTISKILKGGEYVPDGSFDMFFTGETERNKFIGGSTSTLQIKLKGQAIAGTAYQEMNLKFPNIKYKTFPIEEKDEVIGATVAFFGLDGTNAVGTGAVVAQILNAQAAY